MSHFEEFSPIIELNFVQFIESAIDNIAESTQHRVTIFTEKNERRKKRILEFHIRKHTSKNTDQVKIPGGSWIFST